MRTGLYFDLRNPEGWRRDPSARYAAALELAAEAERQGVGAFWSSEHHFTDDDYLPQPLTFAAALAARTRTARIGTAIVAAPLQDPIHLAEQAAVVDLISGGRLELGLGAGYVAGEFVRFGKEIGGRYDATDGAVRRLRELYAGGVVSPLPVQDPLPIWLGYSGPKGARRAGQLGTGLLSLRRDLHRTYLEGLAQGGHDPDAARMGGVVWMLIGQDPERLAATAEPYLEHQRASYGRMASAGSGAGSAPTTRSTDEIDPGFRSGQVIAVTPGDAVARISRALDGLPVSDIYFWADYCGMPDELVAEHTAGIATVAAAFCPYPKLHTNSVKICEELGEL